MLNRDNTVVHEDVSDPYVSVDVGVTRVAKTFVKDNNLNPRWNEVNLDSVGHMNIVIEVELADNIVKGSRISTPILFIYIYIPQLE